MNRALVVAVICLLPLLSATTVAEGDPSPPGEPLALLGVTDVDGGLVLMWQPPLDDGGSPILEYRVYRAQFPDDFSFIGIASSTSFVDVVGADPVALYAYQVTAVNTAGESMASGPCVDVVIEVPPNVIIDPSCMPVACRIVCLWWPPICLTC